MELAVWSHNFKAIAPALAPTLAQALAPAPAPAYKYTDPNKSLF